MKILSSCFKDEDSSADIWVAMTQASDVDFCYGGIRLVKSDLEDRHVMSLLNRLMIYESLLKNQLINSILENHILDNFKGKVSDTFLKSRVGGSRCLIRPQTQKIENILQNPGSALFESHISLIMKAIGKWLNGQEGKVKLTPDLGKFAKIADHLARYTPHVLAINTKNGGCGGKAEYVATGIIATLNALGITNKEPVTLIGANGATGKIILNYLITHKFKRIDICDLDLDNNAALPHYSGIRLRKSVPGMFTDDLLRENSVIIATTYGQELENSNIDSIRPDTRLLLAHNLAIPATDSGVAIMRLLMSKNILAIPGQLMTLGGTFASRLEWFHRHNNKGKLFDKDLAHQMIEQSVTLLVNNILKESRQNKMTPFETMLSYLPALSSDEVPQFRQTENPLKFGGYGNEATKGNATKI